MCIYRHIHIHINIAYLCIYIHRESMDKLLQSSINQDKWTLFQTWLEGPRLVFMQGVLSLPMGAIQFNQLDTHVHSFRFTYFLQLWLTLPLSYCPFWQLICFGTEVAYTCRIIFLPLHSALHHFQLCCLSPTCYCFFEEKLEKEWS